MTVFRRLKTTPLDIANRFAGSVGVDNRLLRRDGAGRTLQDSALVVDDDGCLVCGVTILTPVEAEDAAVITFDGPDGNTRHVVLEGNRQLAFTNWKVGQSLLLRLIQDGTGERTVEWLGQIYWASGFAPTLTETVNHWDCVSLRCIALTEGGQPIFEGYASGFDFGELPSSGGTGTYSWMCSEGTWVPIGATGTCPNPGTPPSPEFPCGPFDETYASYDCVTGIWSGD